MVNAMQLTFPTQAEQAIIKWQALKPTPTGMSFSKLARSMGAFRDDRYRCKVWVFPDETTVEVRGTGKSHTLTAHLP